MGSIIAGFIGLLVIIAIVIQRFKSNLILFREIGPLLAGSLQAAVPNLSTTSQWNASYNFGEVQRIYRSRLRHFPPAHRSGQRKNFKSVLNSVLKTGFNFVSVTIGSVVIHKFKSRLRRFWQTGFNLVKSFSSWHSPFYRSFWNWSEIRGCFASSTAMWTLYSRNCVKTPELGLDCQTKDNLNLFQKPPMGDYYVNIPDIIRECHKELEPIVNAVPGCGNNQVFTL